MLPIYILLKNKMGMGKEDKSTNLVCVSINLTKYCTNILHLKIYALAERGGTCLSS